ncbi:hypothetical protein B0H12DRAFT_1237851 [Mycena haematopus]|nr:hypothetical protein B0H12DRAFT_1237851 [Mycena haematopus]
MPQRSHSYTPVFGYIIRPRDAIQWAKDQGYKSAEGDPRPIDFDFAVGEMFNDCCIPFGWDDWTLAYIMDLKTEKKAHVIELRSTIVDGKPTILADMDNISKFQTWLETALGKEPGKMAPRWYWGLKFCAVILVSDSPASIYVFDSL